MISSSVRDVNDRDMGNDSAQFWLFGAGTIDALTIQPQEAAVLPSVDHRFYVNQIQCALFADALETLELFAPKDTFAFQRETAEVQSTSLIHLIGICDRLNWDFVLGTLAPRLWDASDGFSIRKLEEISVPAFKRMFDGYSRADGSIEFGRRLDNVRQIAAYVRNADVISKLRSATTIHGEHGVLSILQAIPIYNRDPLFKKVNALLHEMIRRNLISVADPNDVEPAIDYHILRLYLRTGRVAVVDREIEERLIRRTRFRIELTTELRRTVSEALKYTAWMAGVSVSRLNELEWAFGRTACRRDRVWCDHGHIGCPVEHICLSAGRGVLSIAAEPVSKHGFY